MIISHSHRFVFIHIPKTAGTSITSVLRQYGPPEPNHRTAAYMRRRNPKFDDYISFAIIRSPWDQLASLYWHGNWTHRYKADIHSLRKRFACFICEIEQGRHPSHRSQIRFLNSTGSDSPDDKIIVDHLFKFEQIQESWKELCQLLDIPFQELPHKRKKRRPHYTEFYSACTEEKVFYLYQPEIKLWDYKFGE